MSVLVCEFNGKEWIYKEVRHEEIHRDGSVTLCPKTPTRDSNSYNIPPPQMPLDRVTNETRQVGICPICKSSMIYKYWLQLWGKKRCVNKFCRNSI